MLIKLKFRVSELVLGMLFAVALFVLGMTFSFHYQPNNGNQDHARSEETKQKTLSAPTEDLIFGIPALDIFTGILALATILLMGITAYGIRNQRKTTEIIERAYIAAIPLNVRPFHDAGSVDDNKVTCIVELKNVGHLAATRVKYKIRHIFDKMPLLERFQDLKGTCDGNIILAPGLGMKKGLTDPPTKADFDKERVADPSKTTNWFYVFGRIEYFDGFQDRWMEFCFRYSMAAAKSDYTISEEEARYHEHGYRTDEDS